MSPNPLGHRTDDDEAATNPHRPPVKSDAVMAPEAMIEVVDNDDNLEDYDPDNYDESDEDKPTEFEKDNKGSSDRPIFVTFYIVLFLALGGLAFAATRYIQAKNENRQQAAAADKETEEINEILANRDSTAYKLQLQAILSDVVKSSTLLTPSSPQAQAVAWMVFEDSALTMEDLVAAADSGDPFRVHQRYALMALFFATGGELWEDTPWTENGEVHECDFVGVDCDESEQVVILDLFLRKLRGRLPDDLGLLTQLSALIVGNNRLEGSIPAFFFDRLTNLEFLDLSRNDFSSSLSPEFAKLTNLHTLVLNELSALTGSLPDALANLTNMKDLQLHQTQVTGRIFDFAASWPKLEVLDIGQAHVTGTLPTTIGISNKNLKSLRMLDARINATNLPTELGMLTKMNHFQVWSSLVDGGTIPTEFGNCKKLQILEIQGNSITGSIPTELGYLTDLYGLILQTQGLTGSVPSEIGLLTGLNLLQIGRNQLAGELPSELSNLKELSVFDVQTNFLTGAIPSGVCNDYILIDRSCGITECDCCRMPCRKDNPRPQG